MRKVIGLALAASSLVALPSAANAQYYHHSRTGYYGYNNYRYARPPVRIRTYDEPTYGYNYGYAPAYGYGYPSYSYGYGYPAYGYNYGYNYRPAYNGGN